MLILISPILPPLSHGEPKYATEEQTQHHGDLAMRAGATDLQRAIQYLVRLGRQVLRCLPNGKN